MSEKKVIDSKLLDSSVWLDYFHNSGCTEIINSNETILTSTLSLFEIKKKLIKDQNSTDKITKGLELIKSRSLLISPDTKICELAAEISTKNNLPAMDSLIYSTALNNKSMLITIDNDFRGLQNVFFPK